ncbi:MAG: DUF814 domain-containing protein [Polyangiaceae bacterium]|nr:DUF814 domain-containing protein [Polyangiaceae bacterium]
MASRGKPYRTLRVDGWEILVGRGDEENEHLTFGVAQPRDLWLHAGGGTPGSHVVIRNPSGGEVPRQIVQRAAELAAWHSKARSAKLVEVHVCRAADVSKPRGAKRGTVSIKREKRVKVRPEGARQVEMSGEADSERDEVAG